MSALERLSSIRRLVQRLTSREDAPEAPASPTQVINEHIRQQRSSYRAHLRHDSHLSYAEKKAIQIASATPSLQPQRQASIELDVSDELVDDDAIELNVDDSFLAEMMTEPEMIRPLNNTKQTSSDVNQESRDMFVSKDSDSAEDNIAPQTEHFILSTDSTDNISLFEELSGHYFFALNANNNDPLPFEDICPVVIEFAAQQLEQFNWSKLKSRRCLEQCVNGLPTVRWSQDVKDDRFACWTCSMTKESVCMRWLGGNAFLILPLLPRLRRQGIGPESLEYWVWSGPA